MSDHLQHDPRTKQQIKDGIYAFLYAPVEKQFKQRIDSLIVKNTVISGYTHKSFMFKNVFYTCDSDAPPRRMNRLHIKCQPDMLDYIRDLKQLNEKEMPFVLGYINQVLNSSNDLHDYLRLLPEAVHFPIQELINSCPCRTKSLSDETVALLKTKNQSPIDMMKSRMVTNLLI